MKNALVVFVVVLAVLLSVTDSAARKLRDLIPGLYGGDGITLANPPAGSRFPSHAPHFTIDSAAAMHRLNEQIATEVAIFPFSSSVGGFAFAFELEADTAEARVALAQQQQPALILMDVQLPGMDGREAIKILKADASTRYIPIVALTAFAMKGDREDLLADGFDGYVSKPIDIKELPKMLESYLGGQAGAQSGAG